MKKFRLENMKSGWFVGDFEPSAFKTDSFEVCHRVHSRGEKWDKHTHKVAIEINLLVKGRMNMCGEDLTSGDIFIVYPSEISDPVFHEDCEIVCIKTPSVPADKYIIK